MAVQTLKVGGKKFVVLPESEYRKLTAKPVARKKSAPSRRNGPSKQDAGDLAEHRRRMAKGQSRPYSELRKELGLE